MPLTKYLPVILLLATVTAVSGQEAGVRRPGLHITAADLLQDPLRPRLRLGLSPLGSDFLLPVPDWSALADADRWSLPGEGGPPSLAGVPPLAPVPPRPIGVPDSVTVVQADTTRGGRGFREIELPDVVRQVADLGLRVEGRSELGGSWNSYRPCEPGLQLNCRPDAFPRLQPDIQFGVQVGGVITDRIHVDVDYDQRREFDAANNINVYYEGEPGEPLQRVEMGDVSIDLPGSRYLTQGIPSGNFGFKTTARFGAVDVEALWAQQKGDIATREFRLGATGQEGLYQDQELVLDDAAYATGQFFFLVDPTTIAGWPHVDVLTLDRLDAPSSWRPEASRLAVYRDEGATFRQFADQARSGTFLADAVSGDGTARHSGLFRLLEPGLDYYIHSSGLWIALRAPLRDDEAVAVTYRTEAGTQVGDPVPESLGPSGATPELLLVRGPVTIHQPGQPTWPWEMHQVYRLDSSAQVEPSTLELVISLGHASGGITFKQFGGGRIPLLRLFGLDDDAPADRLDAAHLFRPGAELDALEPSPLRGTFIVFPTLEPFGTPPPVPSEGLSAAESAVILGGDANPTIYDEPDPVIRESSSRFRLNFRYRVRLEGLLSSFNLGAFGIRQGSERISVDDRLLARGVEYVIDYDLGLVTLLDPEATLGGNPDAVIRASWEQRSLFDIAPTTVFGLNARTGLGDYGELNLVGLYQGEQSVVRRPQLGTAPGSVVLGGASGRMAFQADWVVRALEAIPWVRVDSVARLDVTGELALSAPDPNRKGATYLDDFESTDQVPLSLDADQWQLGSAPEELTGVPLLTSLSPQNAAQMVWQDRYLVDGEEFGFLTPNKIDNQIAFTGSRLAEPVLYLTMGGGPRPVDPVQWRSITTVLSPTGQDLSRSEYLEFYARPFAGPVQNVTLVVDIGSVSEDAFYVDPATGAVQGTAYGRPWGLGTLDAEAALRLREVWGREDDEEGLWGEQCEADPLNAVPLGDPRANCTVLNGRPDTEDLNASGVLDAMDGPAFRYVVPIGPTSPYLVRDQAATGTDFRLFRIPLRGPGAIPLNGASDASWRFVKHLRVTMVKPNGGLGTVAVARLRIAGSRWTKRDISGVVSGETGYLPGTGALSANVRVGSVSQLSDGSAYQSPPGVETEPQDPRSALGGAGVEFNEKSLRLSWEGLPADERAEVYFRYPQQPRSFLEYRKLRFWAVPRAGSWGPGGAHSFLVKIGTDPRNYYVYRTPLHSASTGDLSAEAWLPEHVVEFEEFFALKAEAEDSLASNGGGPLILWNEAGTHGLVLEDRARAPNLAAVRELTIAVYNGGALESDGEVWIDDIRLDDGATQPGLAGRVDLDLNAGGVLTAAVSYGGRGGRFRQLDGAPSFETVNELSINTTTELGRLMPESWGLAMPVTVSYLRSDVVPIFLRGTDVPADRLPGLRDSGTTRRRIGMTLRKITPTANPVLSALVDGTTVRVGHVRASDATVTTAARLDGYDAGVQVDRSVAELDVGIVPGFLETLLRWLAPGRVEESPFFDRVTDARLRLTPERVGLSASYVTQESDVWRYDRVLETPADLDVRPTRSPRRTLESGARVGLRPLESLTASVGVVTGRDLLDPERATPLEEQREALDGAVGRIAGVPLGWERDRVMTTEAGFRPAVSDWLRPSVSWTSRFALTRTPSHIEIVETPGGPAAVLERTFNADRRMTRGLIVDPAAALRAAVYPPTAPPGADSLPPGWRLPLPTRVALAMLRPLMPVELAWTDELASRFDRDLADPGLSFQLGLGGLDRFRLLGDDTAAIALRREAFRARSGVRITSTLAVRVGYYESDTRAHDLRAGPRAQLERAWPDVQLSWANPPVFEGLAGVIEQWSFSTGFVRTERALRLGDEVVRVRSQLDHTVPFEVRLGVSGMAFSYAGSVTFVDGEDPTGRTDRTSLAHAVSVSGRFDAPRPLRQTIPEPIRMSFSYDYQEQEQRRLVSSLIGKDDPTAFIDHVNRRVNLTLSSLVSQIDVGVQASWVDRRSFIGKRPGSSQFQLGVFGQFNLQAGDFPGGPR
jgi:hypothetical protein